MQYRPLGKTGLSASAVGLGAEHLDNKPYATVEETIHAALDAGINIMDLFMPGEEVRSHIGRALGKRRKDMIIQGHIGSCDLREQYDRTRDVAVCERYFEALLRCLDTDYIDLGMFFFIDTEEDYKAAFESPYSDYVQKLKREGKILHIGASSHDPAIAARMVETGLIEALMFPVNLAFDLLPPNADDMFSTLENGFKPGDLTGFDETRQALYRLCEARGVGITTMKTLGAGKLISAEHTPFEKPMTVAQCIHYALSRPAVASTLLGCASRQEVETAVAYFAASDEEKDFSPAANGLKAMFKGACVYCNHCLPCPAEINIAAVHRALDLARLGAGAEKSAAALRASFEAPPSDCIECGACESRCPFGVRIIENMREAAKLFA